MNREKLSMQDFYKTENPLGSVGKIKQTSKKLMEAMELIYMGNRIGDEGKDIVSLKYHAGLDSMAYTLNKILADITIMFMDMREEE